MNRRFTLALTLAAMLGMSAFGKNPMVGGKEMFPEKNIVQNAVNSADHTTLVAAVKAAGLVDTLQTPGPFTVFAPVPENKEALVKVLTYHVVPGKLSSMDLKKQIKAGNGKAMLKTVAGGTLWATTEGKWIVLKDEKGGMSKVTQANVFQSNGVIHVIDTVVLPN